MGILEEKYDIEDTKLDKKKKKKRKKKKNRKKNQLDFKKIATFPYTNQTKNISQKT